VLSTGNKPSQSGFSLVELMVGVVILGILASVAVPSFQVWLQNSQIRNAAEAISNGLQRARAEAVAQNSNVVFILSADSSWSIRLSEAGNLIDSRLGSDGSRNVLVTTTPAINDRVTFNSFGAVMATNPDNDSLPFTTIDVDSAILSADESQNLRITLGLSGIKMCDPNAPSTTARAC
jgi:type IV fimbrial biogenesis protein FimT